MRRAFLGALLCSCAVFVHGGGGGAAVASCKPHETHIPVSVHVGDCCYKLAEDNSTNADGTRRRLGSSGAPLTSFMNPNGTQTKVELVECEKPAMHFVQQIGLLMALNAVVCIALYFMGQSTIVAFILVGVITGQVLGEAAKSPAATSVLGHFSEIGILMLLFMAGLEVEIDAFIKRARVVSIMALGQIAINTTLGVCVGLGLEAFAVLDPLTVTLTDADGKMYGDSGLTLVYFGLCLTFSSTIVVLGMLKNTKQMESLQGQICLGTLVLQDVTAVLSLAILEALRPTGEAKYTLGVSLGRLVGLMIAFGVFMFLAAKYVLEDLFFHLAHSGELLFVGVMGWAMSFAGLASVIDFSPEIAAMMAGVALTVLPYKMEIEDKVEPIKTLGVTIFFITLGLNIPTDVDVILKVLPQSCKVASIIIFCTMPMILLLAYCAKMKSRPAFMIGGIINQISEFSLILATLCVNKGVFPPELLTILTFACVLTIIVSSVGHTLLEKGYAKFGPWLKCLDVRHDKAVAAAAAAALARGETPKAEHSHHPKPGCVVLLGLSELTMPFLLFAQELEKQIVIVDVNPEKIKALNLGGEHRHGDGDEHGHGDGARASVLGHAAASGGLEKDTGLEEKVNSHQSMQFMHLDKGWHTRFDILPIYANIEDPDTWAEAGLADASLIVCCIRKMHDANLSISHWLKRNKSKAVFVPSCQTNLECLQVYHAGAKNKIHDGNVKYAVNQDQLASVKLFAMLDRIQIKDFEDMGKAQQKVLQAIKKRDPKQFRDFETLGVKFAKKFFKKSVATVTSGAASIQHLASAHHGSSGQGSAKVGVENPVVAGPAGRVITPRPEAVAAGAPVSSAAETS